MANIGIIELAKNQLYTEAHRQSDSRRGTGYFVVSGCDVHQAGTPGMSVVVDAGVVAYGNVSTTVTGATVAVDAADATYPRFDVVYVNASGVPLIHKGTPLLIQPAGTTDPWQMSQPYPATSIPTGVILATVYVGAAVTSILTTKVQDCANYGLVKAVDSDLLDSHDTSYFMISDIANLSATTATPVGATDILVIKTSAGVRYITADNLSKGYDTIDLTPGGWPSVTSGCDEGLTPRESSTYKQSTVAREFPDGSADLYIEWGFPMPKRWDGLNVYATFYWETSATSGNVIWGLQGRTYGDGETMDAAWGTAIYVTDGAGGSAYMNMVSSESGAITIAGSPAGGKWIQLRAIRKLSDSLDTLAATARLKGIQVRFGVNKWSD